LLLGFNYIFIIFGSFLICSNMKSQKIKDLLFMEIMMGIASGGFFS
jgi:hypothetical protein